MINTQIGSDIHLNFNIILKKILQNMFVGITVKMNFEKTEKTEFLVEMKQVVWF